MLSGSEPQLRVLVVCTANLCRSPIAEHLLRRAVTEAGLAWDISSAGVRAGSGQPIHRRAAAELRRRGVEVADGWHTRRLTGELVARADLVLTAESEHRQHIVTTWPARLRETYLLRHFARLAGAIESPPPVPAAEFLERAAAALSHVQPATHGEDELADPVGGRRRAFRSCADAIEAAVTMIVAPLRG